MQIGLGAVVGGLHGAAVAVQQAVGGAADVLVGIDHQHPAAPQRRPLVHLHRLRMGLGGRHLLTHLLDHLLDVAGVAEDALQPLDDFRLVADVALHDVDGLVEDFVHRQGHGAVDGLDAFRRRAGLLRHQQFQRVQGRGHVAAEDFQELQVALAERPRLDALDVEGADHLVVPQQRHGQRTLRAR